MAYGKRDGFSYLDGMPVKISETFRAPRKVVLPVHFNPSIPTELLTEEYDFTLEGQVLVDAERRRQTMEKLQNAKVEKVASDIETFSQNNPLSESDSIESESFIQGMKDEECRENVNSETKSAMQQPWQATDILTPQPLESLTTSNPVLQPKGLNLADFENETSPFDYMELQTINDLEELSTVFQGIAINTHDGRRVLRSQAPFLSTREFSAIQNNSQQHLDKFSAFVDAKNAKVSFSSPAYLSTIDKANFANGPNEDLSYLSNGYSFQPKVLYNLGGSTETTVAELDSKINRNFQKMRSAKSFSDIPTEVEGAASEHGVRSRTPPPVPYFSLLASITRKSNSSFDQLHYSTCNPSTSISSLQEDNRDPFLELNHEQQTLVSNIADMGFSRGRVARAVSHIGIDDKKVIDYLCLVQSLEDVGYDGYETETALQLHNYDASEAKSFLDLLHQFQDLGFDKDLARNALVLHKNDRDKALDSLLT